MRVICRMLLPLFFVFINFMLYSINVLAGEATGQSGHEQITFMGDWLPKIINFIIIAAAVIYFTRKPIRDFFKNRSLEIAKAIKESQEAREKAMSDLAEMDRKVKDLKIEMNRMISDAQSRGEKDKHVLIEEGNKIVQDIQEQIKQSIEMEVRKAKGALATEASLLSINLAEGKIKETISSKDHERIVREYITKIGGTG